MLVESNGCESENTRVACALQLHAEQLYETPGFSDGRYAGEFCAALLTCGRSYLCQLDNFKMHVEGWKCSRNDPPITCTTNPAAVLSASDDAISPVNAGTVAAWPVKPPRDAAIPDVRSEAVMFSSKACALRSFGSAWPQVCRIAATLLYGREANGL
jgi:hypothetical protein